MKKTFMAASLLIGTIVGAGILSLPYAFSKSGFFLGFLSLILATLIIMITSFIIVDMGRPGEEISKVIGKNLGKYGYYLVTISLLLTQFGAIIAYNKGVGSLIEDSFKIPAWLGMGIITIIFMILSYLGVRGVAGAESVLVVILISFLFVISIYLLGKFDVKNIRGYNPHYFMYSFGASLFAISGFVAVPEVLKLVNKKRSILAIIFAYGFVFLLYTLFSLSFLGAFGNKIKEIAVENLQGIYWIIGATIAAVSMLSSYLSLGYISAMIIHEDFKIGKVSSILVTYTIPYLIAFLGNLGFVDVISFTGGLTLTLTGILTGISYWRWSKKKIERFIATSIAGVYVILFFFSLVGAI